MELIGTFNNSTFFCCKNTTTPFAGSSDKATNAEPQSLQTGDQQEGSLAGVLKSNFNNIMWWKETANKALHVRGHQSLEGDN